MTTSNQIATANERLYIHETIQISVRHRQKYLQHFLKWAPISRELYNMRLVGVWAVNGSTHDWPVAIVLWELDGLAAFSKMLAGEYAHLQDPNAPVKDHYTLYWGEGEEGVVDTKGTDRLLAPAFYSPSLAQAVERKITGAGYLHETVKGPPGSIGPFLEKLGREWVPFAGRLGLKLVGAYRSMLLNDEEAIVIWAIPTWDDWARYQKALYSEAEAIAWRADAARAGIGWEGKLLNPAAGSALQTGKIV
jgi:hypothetical protein